MQLTRSQLAAVAAELNEQLGIEPPIDVTLSRAELKAKVRDASALVTPNDKLSDKTREVVDFFLSENSTEAKDAAASESEGEQASEEAPKEKPAKKAKKAKQAKAEGEKGERPNMKHEGSMAQFIDALLQKTTDPETIRTMLEAEAEKRGIKAPTLGSVRAHLKFRQSKGHLQGIEIPR